jgi:hypothetical protein
LGDRKLLAQNAAFFIFILFYFFGVNFDQI